MSNQKGVKQGASTSPILFNLLISRIIRVFKAQGLGAFIGNTYVGLLAFADDIALVCRSFEEMQNVLNCLGDLLNRFQLTLNTTKTKYMSNRRDHLQFRGQEIENVRHYKYLGKIIQEDLGHD